MPPGFTVPLGQSYSGTIAATGRPLFVADAQNDPANLLAARDREAGIRTFLGLPVKIQDEVLGVLTFNTTEPHEPTPDELAYLASFADQAAVAIRSVQLRGESERRRREAELLAALGRDINASLHLDTVLQRVAAVAKELCGSDMARIALRASDGDAPGFRYVAGPGAEGGMSAQIEPGKGVGGQVLLTGRPFRTDDYYADPRISADYVELARLDGVVAELAAPIRGADRIEGLIYAQNRARRPFTDRDETVLEQLADHAAIAIKNARLYEEARHQAQEIERGRTALEARLRETGGLLGIAGVVGGTTDLPRTSASPEGRNSGPPPPITCRSACSRPCARSGCR